MLELNLYTCSFLRSLKGIIRPHQTWRFSNIRYQRVYENYIMMVFGDVQEFASLVHNVYSCSMHTRNGELIMHGINSHTKHDRPCDMCLSIRGKGEWSLAHKYYNPPVTIYPYNKH